MAEKKLENIFFFEKPVRIMILLAGAGEWHVSKISRKAECTNSHAQKLLGAFKDMGLVSFNKKGRAKFVSLTEKGLEISKSLSSTSSVIQKNTAAK